MTNQPTNAEPPTLLEYIATRIEELEERPHLQHDDANVQTNSSLTLIQASETAKLAELKHLRNAAESDGVRVLSGDS